MSSPLTVSIRDLARRAGSVRQVELAAPAPEEMGNEVLRVPQGSDIDLDLTLTAVSDGILVTGPVRARLAGECTRCLDPIDTEVTAELTELFYHPDVRARLVEDGDEDAEEYPVVDGDDLDLEVAVRDAIVLDLPFTPLCRPDCPGLCSVCGIRLADAEPGHAHEDVDPRWAALSALASEDAPVHGAVVSDPDAGYTQAGDPGAGGADDEAPTSSADAPDPRGRE
ncbi:YceD family protein [Georgenia sp. Z1344]|uniref:YceD family protein n=1 Tax=Georgenia sp. Z1344 TaxID=3416706 RepID=UPI003CF559CC